MRKLALTITVVAIAAAAFLWLRQGPQGPKQTEQGRAPVSEETLSEGGDEVKGHTARKIFAEVSPAVTWEFMEDPGDPAEVDKGKHEVLLLFEEEYLGPFPDEEIYFLRRFVVDESLIVDEIFAAGTQKGKYCDFPPSGKRVGAQAIWFRWYLDDKLKRLVTYSDRLTTILTQLGHLPVRSMTLPEVPPPAAEAAEVEAVKGAGDKSRIATVRAVYAAFGEADRSVWKSAFTEKTRFKDIATNTEIIGVDTYIKQMEVMERAFPDATAKVLDAFAVKGFVITRVQWNGTHSGPLGKLKPTNKKAKIRQAQVFEFEGDKVVELRTYSSRLDFMSQLDPMILSAYSGTPRVLVDKPHVPDAPETKPPPRKTLIPQKVGPGLPYDPAVGPGNQGPAAADAGSGGNPRPPARPRRRRQRPETAPHRRRRRAPRPRHRGARRHLRRHPRPLRRRHPRPLRRRHPQPLRRRRPHPPRQRHPRRLPSPRRYPRQRRRRRPPPPPRPRSHPRPLRSPRRRSMRAAQVFPGGHR